MERKNCSGRPPGLVHRIQAKTLAFHLLNGNLKVSATQKDQ